MYIIKMENCALCLKRSKCNHSFISLPFCDNCGVKLYNNQINITKSMNENKIIFNDDIDDDNDDNDDDKEDCLLNENEKLKIIQQKLAYSKHLIDEMIKNMDDKCILNDNIRKLNSAVQQAFFYIDR